MFKIAYKDLRTEQFKQAMLKLANCCDYPMKTGYHIMRVAKLLEQELKKSTTDWVELCNKLIKKDEKGDESTYTTDVDGLGNVDVRQKLHKIVDAAKAYIPPNWRISVGFYNTVFVRVE